MGGFYQSMGPLAESTAGGDLTSEVTRDRSDRSDRGDRGDRGDRSDRGGA